MPRRNFFRQLFSETIGLAEELRGKPQMRLRELEQMPDEVVRRMTPVFNEYRSYLIEDNRVLLKPNKTEAYQEIYRLNPIESYVLRYFDGQHTLERLGQRASDEFGQNNDIVYQQVKALFIVLAKHAICFPVQAHDD